MRPIRDGVIADFDATEKMLNYFIRKTNQQVGGWARPRVVFGVPSRITPVERRAVRESAYRAKVSEVFLVDQPMAAAFGAGLPITEAAGSMIIDIGGGTTDIAVISLSGVVISKSVRVAGDAFDEAIILHMKRRHEVLVGERTAEDIKMQIGFATKLDKPLTMEVKGRHIGRGVPVKVTLEAAHIKLARGDLNRWFTFGAYASAGVDRPEIVHRAIERGEAMLGRDVPNTEIYVVGDTPLDISAAHANGCTAIAVATGRYDVEALREAGADHVLETLEEELPLEP